MTSISPIARPHRTLSSRGASTRPSMSCVVVFLNTWNTSHRHYSFQEISTNRTTYDSTIGQSHCTTRPHTTRTTRTFNTSCRVSHTFCWACGRLAPMCPLLSNYLHTSSTTYRRGFSTQFLVKAAADGSQR